MTQIARRSFAAIGSDTGPLHWEEWDGLSSLSGDGILITDRIIHEGVMTMIRRGDHFDIVFHWYDAANNGTPTLGILPLRWTADGWPTTSR